MQKKNSYTELEKILEILQKFNVVEFEENGVKIKLGPAKLEPIKKDLSLPPAKTKEQEAEELLFHSTGR